MVVFTRENDERRVSYTSTAEQLQGAVAAQIAACHATGGPWATGYYPTGLVLRRVRGAVAEWYCIYEPTGAPNQ